MVFTGPSELGENITTRGIDLLALPRGTILKIGETVRLEATGLRYPCRQIDAFRNSLMTAVLAKGANGELVRKSGVMTVVLAGGPARPGDRIEVTLPEPPHLPLAPV